jgi:drug/metabolite transporter (DMT)-like permease
MDTYIILALVISFLWGLQPVIHKHLLNKINPVSIMFLSSAVNFSLIVLLVISRIKEVTADIKKLTPRDIFLIVGISVFAIFMANIIYYYILKDNESSIISALIYSSPVFTLILAYLFLEEKVDSYGVSGILAIIIGIILISQNNKSVKELEYISSK